MLDWLDSFTVLIQTITAVNFTYILTHYPDSIFKLVFNDSSVDKIYEKDNTEISADIASLNAIDLDAIYKNPQGAVVERESLLANYLRLNEKWAKLLNGFKEKIRNARSVKGFKCLFLLSSLFCLITILNISLKDVVPEQSSLSLLYYSFVASLNIFTLLYSLYLTAIINIDGWKNRDEHDCYRSTIIVFVIIVFLSLVLAYINMKRQVLIYYAPDNIPTVLTIIFSLSVVLPFYPCIVGFIYVIIQFLGFGLVWIRSLKLKLERKKLHKEKKGFDKLNNFGAFVKFE